ncbi:MAG: tetratricopeptide repeat protein [Pyrinomonadaceae bacterium]
MKLSTLNTFSLTAGIILCCFQSQFVAAQTTSREPDSRARSINTDNSAAVYGETTRAAPSPAAVAEARKLYKEGRKYVRAGLFTQAADLFRRSVELKPDYVEAYESLGDAYIKLSRWDEALRSFQDLLALKPKDKDTLRRIDQVKQTMLRENSSGGQKSVTASPESQQPAGVQVSLNPARSSPAVSMPPAESTTDPAAKEMALTKVYFVGPGDVLDVRVAKATSPESQESTLLTVAASGLLEHPGLTDPLPVGNCREPEGVGGSSRLRKPCRSRCWSCQRARYKNFKA